MVEEEGWMVVEEKGEEELDEMILHIKVGHTVKDAHVYITTSQIHKCRNSQFVFFFTLSDSTNLVVEPCVFSPSSLVRGGGATAGGTGEVRRR